MNAPPSVKSRDLPAAVVLGGGHNALGVFRSLGPRGIRILAVHTNPRDAALRSKFCAVVIPPCDPADDEERYVEFLMGLSSPSSAAPVLIPTGDAEVMAISRHRGRLLSRFRFVMAEHSVIESLIDKQLFSRLAERHGLLAPRSYILDDPSGLEALSREMVYPCVIKPARSRAWGDAGFQRRFGGNDGWTKRLVVGSRDELLRVYPAVAAFDKRLLVQEYIEGGDDTLYDFYSYLDEDLEPLGCFMIRKLRTLPIDGNGIGTCVESVWEQDLADTSLRFLKAIGFRGNSAVCFKRCVRTGRFYVIEVNARLALHHSLAAYCGVDLAYMSYLEAAGSKPTPAKVAERKVRWLSFWDDLAAFRRYAKRGDWNLRTWLASLQGEKTHCFFALGDIRPFALKSAEALLVEALGRSRLRRALGTARRGALKAGYYSGVLWAARRLTRIKKSGLLILLYHSIGRPAELDPYLSVSEKHFAGQLEYLARHYEVMSLAHAVALIERGESLPKTAAAITFDDGYRDNYDKALPLLERHGCTATFFVSTAPLSDRRPLWPNELFLWFAETRAARLELPAAALHGDRSTFELASARQRKAAFRSVEALLFRVGNAERERLIGEIAERLGVSRAADRPAMLTWAQVKKMAAAGMTIGSHTATHPVLSTLTAEETMKELTASKAALEQELGRPVTLFAYPFGGPADFNRETQALVRKAGYTAACSTILGVNESGANRLALKRVGVHDDPPGLFAFRLSRLQH